MAVRKPAVAAAGAVPRCDKLLGEIMADVFRVYGKPPRSRGAIMEILAALSSASAAMVYGACVMPSRLWRGEEDPPAANDIRPRHLH